MSLALAGGFFTTSATWEAHEISLNWDLFPTNSYLSLKSWLRCQPWYHFLLQGFPDSPLYIRGLVYVSYTHTHTHTHTGDAVHKKSKGIIERLFKTIEIVAQVENKFLLFLLLPLKRTFIFSAGSMFWVFLMRNDTSLNICLVSLPLLLWE